MKLKEVSIIAWKIKWLKLHTKDCIATRDIAIHKMLWKIHTQNKLDYSIFRKKSRNVIG